MPGKKTIRSPTSKKKEGTPGSTEKFEALLQNARPRAHYELLLYVAGNTPRSTRAIANVRSLCDEYLPKRHTLEVIDIYQQPSRASEDQIIAAPTLLRRKPRPPKRLIGDLSDRARVVVALNLTPARSSVKSGASTQWIEL